LKLLNILKGKIHRATVTACEVDYEGSITVDEDLLDAAGMVNHELVKVWNVTNGERLETYTIRGERGSGVICLNGAAALKCSVGDRVIIAAFCMTDEPVEAKIVFVDGENKITSTQH